MGGLPGGKGSIATDKLKKVIKDDFEMTIDIEVHSFAILFQKLIKDIDMDGSGTIEYTEFKNLLTSH